MEEESAAAKSVVCATCGDKLAPPMPKNEYGLISDEEFKVRTAHKDVCWVANKESGQEKLELGVQRDDELVMDRDLRRDDGVAVAEPPAYINSQGYRTFPTDHAVSSAEVWD